MGTEVFIAAVATAIAIEPGNRIGTTGNQVLIEYV
jgi:hypothetical protein